jgi:hypothetical protein
MDQLGSLLTELKARKTVDPDIEFGEELAKNLKKSHGKWLVSPRGDKVDLRKERVKVPAKARKDIFAWLRGQGYKRAWKRAGGDTHTPHWFYKKDGQRVAVYHDEVYGTMGLNIEPGAALKDSGKAPRAPRQTGLFGEAQADHLGQLLEGQRQQQIGLDFTAPAKFPRQRRTRSKGGLPPDQIVRILDVVDTREYEEIADGVFKPVRGSGNESFCARCGRPHEVHATVELQDKRTAVVGTGCMKGSRLEKEAKAGASAAKTIARWEAELAQLEATAKKYKTIQAQVDKMRPPPAEEIPIKDGDLRIKVKVGDAKSYVWPIRSKSTKESLQMAKDQAVTHWRRKRMEERGMSHRQLVAGDHAKELKRKLDKKKAALKALTRKRA